MPICRYKKFHISEYTLLTDITIINIIKHSGIPVWILTEHFLGYKKVLVFIN
jgi:hypothetical protein